MSDTLSDSERDGGHNAPIRDAACLILVDRSQQDVRMLMGRRHSAQVFLPNKWVFPGGGVDDDDRALAQISLWPRLEPTHERRPFALAAVRETFEETGLLVCAADRQFADPPKAWKTFAGFGGAPDIDSLIPIARAITPPGRPRRFDTWFFAAEWNAGRYRAGEPDGELLDLDWFTVDNARQLDLPIITRLIVDDVATWISESAHEVGRRIPFYFQEKDSLKRELILV